MRRLFQALGLISFDTYEVIKDENGEPATTTINHIIKIEDSIYNKEYNVPRFKTIKNKRYINYLCDEDPHYNEVAPNITSRNKVGDLLGEFQIIKLHSLCKAA